MLGDFNFDLLKPMPSSKTWLQSMENLNLTQMVNSATRVTETTSTLIDHVFTNNTNNIIEVCIPDIKECIPDYLFK